MNFEDMRTGTIFRDNEGMFVMITRMFPHGTAEIVINVSLTGLIKDYKEENTQIYTREDLDYLGYMTTFNEDLETTEFIKEITDLKKGDCLYDIENDDYVYITEIDEEEEVYYGVWEPNKEIALESYMKELNEKTGNSEDSELYSYPIVKVNGLNKITNWRKHFKTLIGEKE